MFLRLVEIIICERIVCALLQMVRTIPLVVFYEPHIEGWSIRTLENIKEGEFITAYLGGVSLS